MPFPIAHRATAFAVQIGRPSLLDDLEVKKSSAGKYLSVTATFTAESREQVDAIYRELHGHDLVALRHRLGPHRTGNPPQQAALFNPFNIAHWMGQGSPDDGPKMFLGKAITLMVQRWLVAANGKEKPPPGWATGARVVC